MSRAKVWFLGGGPGAPDLLTVRAARVLSEADVVIWGTALLTEAVVADHARPGAELVPWPPATMSDIYAVYDRARSEDLLVARLFWGDPAIYGAVRDEAAEVGKRGVAYEVVAGVSALGASAAALGIELATAPGPSPPLILASPRDEAADGQRVRDLAVHGATMALFMGGGKAAELQDELLAGGFAPGTPCAVAHKVSWPDELVVRCALHELASTITARELDRHSVVLVGPALAGGDPGPVDGTGSGAQP
jgi:precorrin-4 methylase